MNNDLNLNNNNNNLPQFVNIKSAFEQNLKIGYDLITKITKNGNNISEKIQKIQNFINNEENYDKITKGILYGLIYDTNNIEQFSEYLYNLNKDKFNVFIDSLYKLIDDYHMNLTHKEFEQIYIIFNKLISSNNIKLCNLLIIISRCIYPGIDMYIYNKDNKFFLNFLLFIKSKINFITQYTSNQLNLVGNIFIKILRLLSENHFFYTNPKKKDYFKSNDELQYYQNIYENEIYILERLYSLSSENVFAIGRELIRILIQLGKSNIEIVNKIIEDIAKKNNFNKIINLPININNEIKGYNMYVQMNIPPLMEKMITFILTKVNKKTTNYVKYYNWMLIKFNINKKIINSQSILVDLCRYIITCYYNFYNQNYIIIKDATPRWIILGNILLSMNNKIISSEFKQSIFFDWIFFQKDYDDYKLIEPGYWLIFINLKNYKNLTEELIEFLDAFGENFDKKNSALRKNCIYDAIKKFEEKNGINNVFSLIENDNINNVIKEKYKNLVKFNENIENNNNNNNFNNNNFNNNNFNNNNFNTNNFNNNNLNNNNFNNNNFNNNNFNNNNFNNNIDNNKNNNNNNNEDNIIIIESQNQQNLSELQKELLKDNYDDQSLINNDNNNNNNIEINFSISPELSKLLTPYVLNAFLKTRTIESFKKFLNDFCVHINDKYKNSIYNLITLDQNYGKLLNDFSSFFLNIFKNEIELDLNNPENAISIKFFFQYVFNKINTNEFNYLKDIINNLIKNNQNMIIFLMNFILFFSNNLLNTNHSEEETLNMIYQFFKKLFDFNIEKIKEIINNFFNICIDNFYLEIFNNFIIFKGIEIFKEVFYDDVHLVYNLFMYSDIKSLEYIKYSLTYEKYFLFGKNNFYNLLNYSFELNFMEQNKLWSLIFSQKNVSNVKEFLEYFSNKLNNILMNNNNVDEKFDVLNFNFFFQKIYMSLQSLFNKELFINKNYVQLQLLFNFNFVFKDYVYNIFLNLLNIYNNDNNNKCSFVYFFEINKNYIDNNKNNYNALNNYSKIISYIIDIENEKKKNFILFDEKGKYSINEFKKFLKYNNN